MTDDKIAEIRARHEQVPSGNLSIAAISLAHADRATLLAEVDRLRADVERLTGLSKQLAEGLGDEIRRFDDELLKNDRLDAENDRLLAENERLRDVLRRVSVHPSGDRAARVAFVSVGCQVSFPLHPQTTWALELLVEFDQARRAALEGKP